MFEEKDDTIMARWLSGKLTESERAEFEASTEYEEYQKLAQGLKAFQKPAYEKELLRNKIWKGIENQKPTKVIRLKPLYYAAGIAASLVLLFGLFFYQIDFTSPTGEKSVFILPDKTEVYLNAKTSISYNPILWSFNKKILLDGEALFHVTKGDNFKVETKSGTISVLGTTFNVNARSNFFELHCYEGRILYSNQNEDQETYLKRGDVVKIQGKILVKSKHNDEQPSWLNEGRSSFSNTELLLVMEALKAHYGIEFDFEPDMAQGHFTGTFVHNDLELALKSVFVPMGINYTLTEDQKTVILNAR
ncbi:FecR family protein [Croceivirga thetidis]|uniref:FecR family protein n=1 Tax=Croceivirga thetidis TaxID=2721623 RepID=A0ABX1GSR3_9FLAO|nr:FecR domain-containing protein [Croceivirga thetidis]NKI31797.1 hypothetical protein [Croceivirga thetidis]